MKKNRIFIYLIGVFIIFCLLLKITKGGVLVKEGKTNYYGTSSGPMTLAKIDCTYFNGLTFRYQGHGYIPDDVAKGKANASCPLFLFGEFY
jgi:hypothetical protein